MKAFFCLGKFFMIIGCWCLVGKMVLAQPEAMDIRFDRETETLSVDIKNKALSEVLNEIGKKMDCKIIVKGSGNMGVAITESFSRVPVQKGIQRLAKDFSLAMIYRISVPEKKFQVLSEIDEIWLFGNVGQVSEANRSTGFVPEKAESISKGKNNPASEDYSLPASEKSRVVFERIFEKNDTDFEFWANKLFDAETLDEKEQSITELKRIGSDDAVAVIATVLGDRDPHLRRYALQHLKLMENERAVQVIGQILLGDSDPEVRKSALDYFIRKTDDISTAFVNAAQNDTDEQIQKLARKALDNL